MILIEMSGPSEGYIAFALSHDQWMVSKFSCSAVKAFMTIPWPSSPETNMDKISLKML